MGTVGTRAREGRPVPQGWGLDGAGRPTTDGAAILGSGLLLPMGGHKGAGLSVMMELLTAGLTGGPLSHETAARDSSGLDAGSSKLFLALDAGAFGGVASFEARVEALLDHLRDAEPGRRVLSPGERGWLTRDAYEREGIPVHPDVLSALRTIGVELPIR